MTVSFNKARNRWTYDFRLRGERFQGYCVDGTGQPVTSKSGAVQAEGVERRRAQMQPNLVKGKEVTLSMVVGDLMPGWKREKNWETKKRTATEILRFYGGWRHPVTIDHSEIQRYIEFANSQTVKVWKGGRQADPEGLANEDLWADTGRLRSPATINRRLDVLRLIMGRAAKMRDPATGRQVIDRAPVIEDLPEPKRRARPTPEPVLQRLQEILPAHAIDALTITLYFGFRRSEAFGLKEEHVDWHAAGVRLFAEDVKDAEDVFLPGSPEAMGYLRCLAMEAEARGVRHLISFRREATKHADRQEAWRPIKSARTAWKTAMRVIEAEFGRRWRWHDLRAAFITHIAMTSGPVAAQKLARHSDYDTTRAYIEVADEVTRRAANQAGERPSLRIVGAKPKH